ncbi:MAG: S1 RNA-binding domain-containing protein [Planctomycetota bacterium]
MLPLTARSRIAAEFQVAPEVVFSFEEHLEAGDPIPFLARRFTERFAGLDAIVLRKMRLRIEESRDVELRRANLLKSIEALGEAGEALSALAQAAVDRWQIEDIAAKLRKHKASRAHEAINKGLEPLADAIQNGALDGKSLEEFAGSFISTDKGVATAQEALHGAASILAERFSDEYEVRTRVRREMRDRGEIVSKVFDSSKPGADRYREFFDKRERGKGMSPRRYLKLRQAEKEKILKFTIEINVDEVVADLEKKLLGELAENATDQDRECREFRKNALKDAIARILLGALEVDIRTEWKERADLDAISFLRRQLRQLCMRPPYGPNVVMGVDPGARKGLRVAIVGADGSYICDTTVSTDGDDRAAGVAHIKQLLNEHRVRAISISEDTESDSAQRYFKELLTEMEAALSAEHANATDSPSTPAETTEATVEEATTDETKASENITEPAAAEAAPADVTNTEATKTAEPSATHALPEILRVPEVGVAAIANSPASREEFGDKPVPVRAAVSMARRLQDPIAEYSRIDPKLLSGYHHAGDVARGRLERMLNEEFESCVHEIPVDLNYAPAPLLALVGAMGMDNAKKIVEWRNVNGAFPARLSLARVGLDEQVYKRSVAFLRVYGSADPIDETGVHPDHAPVVEKILAAANVATIRDLNQDSLKAVTLSQLADDSAPLPVLTNVRDLLMIGSSDPRGQLMARVYNEGVRNIYDLRAGLELEGIVRGVANFGVFVDIGAGQDGLIHVSELADHFVKDAYEIVKVNDRVKVRVLEIEPARRKISLTMRSDEARKRAEEERAARRAERQAAREYARERRRRFEEMRARRAQEDAARAKAAEDLANGIPPPPVKEFQTAADAAAAAAAAAGPRPSFDLRNERFNRGGSRQERPAARVAVQRRDGLAGNKQQRRGGAGGPGGFRGGKGGGRKDGRGYEDEGVMLEDRPRQDGAKSEPTAPPANPFKKFFQSKGFLEAPQ